MLSILILMGHKTKSWPNYCLEFIGYIHSLDNKFNDLIVVLNYWFISTWKLWFRKTSFETVLKEFHLNCESCQGQLCEKLYYAKYI